MGFTAQVASVVETAWYVVGRWIRAWGRIRDDDNGVQVKKPVGRKRGRVHEPRVCIACSAEWPPDGPLPYEWDVHQVVLQTRKLVCTCSSACRRKMLYPERKVSA